MIEMAQHDDSYLAICKYYRAVFDTPSVMEEQAKRQEVTLVAIIIIIIIMIIIINLIIIIINKIFFEEAPEDYMELINYHHLSTVMC